MDKSSLKNQTLKGVSWSFIDNFVGSGITFIVGIILARLLSPSEFGIMGMTTVFMAVANSLIDSGLISALIRKNDTKEEDYNTAFIFNLGISILVYGCLYFAADSISSFFKTPLLIIIIKVIGLLIIINALGLVQRARLIKVVNFKRQAIISIIASCLSAGIGIGMAISKCGVWSLVGQQLSKAFFNTLLLWLYGSKWFPSLSFSKSSFNELFNFGYKLSLSSIIYQLSRNLFYVVIGRFYNVAQLGYYTRSEYFSTVFSNNIVEVIQKVTYPVLSSIQNDNDRLKQGYRKVIKIMMIGSFTLMFALIAMAKPVIILLIGLKWEQSIIYLQLICLCAIFTPLHMINRNILQVKGRSDLYLMLEIIANITLIIPLLLGIFVGIVPMILASIFTSFFSWMLDSYYSSRIINYSIKEQYLDIGPSFLIASLTGLITFSLTFLYDENMYILLLLQLTTFIVLNIITHEIFKLDEYREIKKIAKSVFNSF